MSIGGAENQVAHDGPRYSAIYEIDGPHVLISPGWAKAISARGGPRRSKRAAGRARCGPSRTTGGTHFTRCARWRNGLTVTSVIWWHIRPSRALTRMRSDVRGYP
jgi:hypothetical protein